MKATGITRKIDELGRIVIPKENRRSFNISENEDALEIYTEDDMSILRKYNPSCMFCKDARDIVTYKGHLICRRCLAELNKAAEK